MPEIHSIFVHVPETCVGAWHGWGGSSKMKDCMLDPQGEALGKVQRADSWRKHGETTQAHSLTCWQGPSS